METIAALQAKLAKKDKQLQEQIQANTASKQLEGLKLPNSDNQPSLPSLEAATFDQLIKVHPRPEKFSGTSKNVSMYDWLNIMEDWLKNVNLPRPSGAGLLLAPCQKRTRSSTMTTSAIPLMMGN